jgi:hypothetical protein
MHIATAALILPHVLVCHQTIFKDTKFSNKCLTMYINPWGKLSYNIIDIYILQLRNLQCIVSEEPLACGERLWYTYLMRDFKSLLGYWRVLCSGDVAWHTLVAVNNMLPTITAQHTMRDKILRHKIRKRWQGIWLPEEPLASGERLCST